MRRLSTIHYSSLLVSARNEYVLKKSLMEILAFGACGVRILLAGNLQTLTQSTFEKAGASLPRGCELTRAPSSM